ncbi:MAG: 4Fe-4S dicluster domain-containing protein [Selenomonadaceae bacterium]|nr:4Fe-4S dicluster domain-containing protein [Selenomonadaceae bacterium]MDY3915871.1 4Fe-4S dicluster domain-containing protein [Selenomonadaceae bacterium]
MNRRMFIKAVAGGCLLGMVTGAGKLTASPQLRPPGALPETDFLAVCARCGKCQEICPLSCISLLHLDAGLAVGTPKMNPLVSYCDLCMKCTEVCSTGALRSIPKEDVRIGVAHIDNDLCIARRDDDCQTCYRTCPQYGKAIKLERRKYPVIDPDYCTGCGMCEHVCPADPKAVHVLPREEG